MNSEHINAQHQTKRGKETFLSFYLPVACNLLHEIVNHAPRWDFPVACNLLHEIVNHAPKWNFPVACNLLHEIVNHAPRWNFPVACNLLYEKTLSKTTALYSAPRLNHSCIKMHATHEIVNTRKSLKSVPCVLRSCIKMHATDEIVNARKGWIMFRACKSLRGDSRNCRIKPSL